MTELLPNLILILSTFFSGGEPDSLKILKGNTTSRGIETGDLFMKGVHGRIRKRFFKTRY